jgi:DMSO/TMAO reductase YedYZ molybdopterin-dependent catalytic subunit
VVGHRRRRLRQAGVYTLEDILKPHPLEERIYRHRCVEGWSIVVPWVGFPLGDLLKRFEPASNAKFVEFVTVKRPKKCPRNARASCRSCRGRTSKAFASTKRCIRWH